MLAIWLPARCPGWQGQEDAREVEDSFQPSGPAVSRRPNPPAFEEGCASVSHSVSAASLAPLAESTFIFNTREVTWLVAQGLCGGVPCSGDGVSVRGGAGAGR